MATESGGPFVRDFDSGFDELLCFQRNPIPLVVEANQSELDFALHAKSIDRS